MLPFAAALQLIALTSVIQDQPATAIVGATIVEGTGAPPLKDGVVVVRNGRILAVGPKDQIDVPPDARRINAVGKWLIPGLIDMHVHLDEVITPSTFVLFGVTSVRDVGSRLVTLQRLRARESKGEAIPRLYWMGRNIDEGKPSWWGAVAVKRPKDVSALLDDMEKQGVDGVKLYVNAGPKVTKAVIQDAHKRGWPVTGHLSKTRPSQAAEMGIDNLEHVSTLLQELRPVARQSSLGFAASFRGVPRVDLGGTAAARLVRILRRNQMTVTPTLIASLLPVEGEKAATDRYSGIVGVPRGWRAYWTSSYWSFMSTKGWKRIDFSNARLAQVKYSQMLGKLYRAGVPIIAGTDTPAPWVLPGAGLLVEMELMVRAGMTPSDVLRSATGRAADILHKSRDVGTIRTGRIADMILLDADPVADIRNLRRIHSVFLGGKEIDRNKLRTLLKNAAKHP